MTLTRRARTEPGRTAVLAALADRDRRRVLQRLRRRGPRSVGELAAALARRRRTAGTAARDEGSLRAALEHRHLPKLVAADLVERAGDRVALGSHPALDDGTLAPLLSADDEDWDEVLDCLAAPRRRAACAALADADGGLPLHGLARELVARVPDLEPDDLDALCAELHHVHLPKLDAVGLVERPEDGDAVQFRGHALLEDCYWRLHEGTPTTACDEPLS